jgi:hypothetical protein
MKRVLLVTLFVLASIVVFTAAVFFINRNPGEGGLQVTSQPKSRVYLNGKFIGETPLLKQKPEEMIKAGEYKIRLVPDDSQFDPFENKITINPKTLTVVDRTFNKDGAASGSIITLTKLSDKNATELEIISFPDKAKIFLDNNATGFSPILLKNLTESDHEIKLTRDGYQDKTIRIRTLKGFKLETIVFLGISPSLGETETEDIKVSQVLILQTPTGFLRVRADATTSSAEVGRVSPGEKYDLLDEESGWYKIKLENGEEGWVTSQYAQKD